MNLHLLRIFTTVAEHQNFSRAAAVLFISQPAVSKAVQELELQIALPLVDRSQRAFNLTEAGILLHQYAQQLFAVERAAATVLEQLQGLERGSLSLGASHTIGTYFLPSLLAEFHHHYPGIQLSLEIANTQQILQNLRTKPFDLAFVEGVVRDTDLEIVPWQQDRLVIIAPPHHPLTTGSSLSLDHLAKEPYVQREPGSGTREIIEDIFQQRGVPLNVSIELGSNEAVKQAVCAGLGISIVSEATIILECKMSTLIVLDVEDFVFNRTLWQVSIKGKPLSPATLAFQQLLAKAL